MQAADSLSIASGVDSFNLMHSASMAVARATKRILSRNANVVVVAGPGNNGGDGAVAARLLLEQGIAVALLRYTTASAVLGDAQRAFSEWPNETQLVDSQLPVPNAALKAIANADVIVDALFGAGLGRNIDGPAEQLVRAINSSNATVISVDLPSGVDGNLHMVRGVAVQAHHTITFFRFKPAHFLHPTQSYCGQLELAQIGVPAHVIGRINPQIQINDPDLWQSGLPRPSITGHKFQRGHVLLRGGGLIHAGAARLSAQSALQSGAGLVTLTSPTDGLVANAAQLNAVMLRCCNTVDEWSCLLADARISSVVIGPGNGLDELTRRCVEVALETGLGCVLDAGALTSFAACPERLLKSLASSDSAVVLTPHSGEFKRVFGHTDCFGLPSRLDQARCAAKRSHSVVVLKGPDTVIAAPDGRARINSNAPPWLATAGAGDVLAGIIGAFIAQGMQQFDAACAAVWIHGDAALQLGYPLTAEQLTGAAGLSLGRLVKPNVRPPPWGLRPSGQSAIPH